MKVKRVKIIALLLLLFFVVDAVMIYRGSKTFPKWERETVEDIINAGIMPRCSPVEDYEDFEFGFKNTYLTMKKTCFPRSIIDNQIVEANPGRPEMDQVYFQLSCSTDIMAARFQILFSRVGGDTMCIYRPGGSLKDIPKFRTQDMTMTPDRVWLLHRTIIRLSD